MKTFFLSLILVASFLTSPLLAQQSTQGNTTPSRTWSKGVFALRDQQRLASLDAEYLRILIWDSHLKQIYRRVKQGTPLHQIPRVREVIDIQKSGVKLILTLRWADQRSKKPKLYDRVPQGKDRKASLQLLKRFLNDLGPYLAIYSLQNEVGGIGPGTYSKADMTDRGQGSPAVRWLIDLTQTARQTIAANPKLSHIKIASPAPIALKKMVFAPQDIPALNRSFFHEVLKFGNQYTDYIDLHVNRYTLSELKTMLQFIEPLIQKDLISTEWSEVAHAQVFLRQPIRSEVRRFAKTAGYPIPSRLRTNKELVEHMYRRKAPASVWNRLVQSSNYPPGFMRESADLLAKAGFVILCWNSGWQEGKPIYDVRTLFANRTVVGESNTVDLFVGEFKAL